MFFKQNIQLPVLKGAFFPPDKAAEFLMRASSISSKSGFTWVYVDRPSDGSMFLYKVNSGDISIPDDGYGWMDDEVFSKATVGTQEIEIISRSQGFAMGDANVTMTRRRYRLTGNPNFQLLHYTSISSESLKIPIVPSKIRSWPRDPSVLEKMARGETNTNLNPKKKIKTRLNSQVRIQENTSTENLGDELDGSVNILVSTERYKRNHIFIDLIFSPFSAESMKKSDDIIDQKDTKQDIENLKSEITSLESEITSLQAKHLQDKQEFFSGKSLHHDLEDISHISNVNEVDLVLEKWSKAWNCNLGWRPSLIVQRIIKQLGPEDV